MKKIIVQILLLLNIKFIVTLTIDEYQKNRTELIDKQLKFSVGGQMVLDENEKKVNHILMELKKKELNRWFETPEIFNLSGHYFTYKDQFKNSKLFNIIKKMPKGGALHIHSTLALDADYMVKLTYEDNLYACYKDDDLTLRFSNDIPEQSCDNNWKLMTELRSDSYNFDEQLKKHFTLLSEDTYYRNMDRNALWHKFENIASVTSQLINYRPVRERFIYDTLKRFYDDNVMYVEFRGSARQLYELNGTKHEPSYLIKLYEETTERFIAKYPDFIGIKLILTKHRTISNEEIREAISLAKDIKKDFPNIIAGFDIVGEEDKGRPLNDFLSELLDAGDDMNFYFHAGETNWHGSGSDDNLIDAILLGSRRIGHGFALVKHPYLMNIVLKNDIAIEVNVISNVVLNLVADIRNHPLALFLGLGMPVVLSSDDPGAWGAEPLSHDFYVTFVGIASSRYDIRLLKQLAMNSIKYSALDNTRRNKLYRVFKERWGQFLNEVIEQYDDLDDVLRSGGGEVEDQQ